MNPLYALIAASLIHGAIYSILILFKIENKKANVFFVYLIVSLALTIMTYLALKLSWYNQFPWLYWLPFGASYTIAPSFYLYIKYLVHNQQRFRKIELLHFSPLVLNYLHSIYHLINGNSISHIRLHNFTEAIQMFSIFPGIIYLYFTYNEIRVYQREVHYHFSNLDKLTLNWAKLLLNLFVTIYAITLVYVLVESRLLFNYEAEFSNINFLPFEGILVVSYIIALYLASIGTYSQRQAPTPMEITKYSKSSTSKDLEAMGARIYNAIHTDKLYLNPNLNLRFLEDYLGLSAKDISQTLNQHFEKNFYEYVNTFRVNSAKESLINPDNKNLTTEAIGYDSGFNSRATFIRVFKEQTGYSPGAYKASKRS